MRGRVGGRRGRTERERNALRNGRVGRRRRESKVRGRVGGREEREEGGKEVGGTTDNSPRERPMLRAMSWMVERYCS